jgi:hypothetical protein
MTFNVVTGAFGRWRQRFAPPANQSGRLRGWQELEMHANEIVAPNFL